MSGYLDPLLGTTLPNVARGAWDGVSQHFELLKNIKQKGGIEYDVEGGSDGSTLNSTTYELSGSIEAGRYQPTISAPGMDIAGLYQPKKRHTRWTGVFGEIVNAVPIDRGALRRNKGSQLVDLSKTEVPAMIRDTLVGTNGLTHQMLQMIEPAYAGGGLPMYGLPSLLPGNGYDGSAAVTMATAITAWDIEGFTPPTTTGSAGTLTGVAPADTDLEVAINGNTYANYLGLSLEPGALSSAVDGAEWDAWTPTLVNANATGWTGTNDDPDDAVEKFLQYLVFRMSRFGSDPSKKPDFGILDRTYFNYLGAKKASRETIFVSSDKKGVSVPDSGYPVDKILHAGIAWCWDVQMPASTGYCFASGQMKLKVQPLYRGLEQGNPLKLSGEDAGVIETEVVQDPIRRQWLVNATLPGQLICNPRYFGRVSAYSA
jgi:hypothetical protein